MPITGASSAIHRAQATDTPGVCGPVSLAFRKASWLADLASQPVRYRSQPPSGSGPCSDSQCLMCSGSSRKSGSALASALKSSTTAGAIRLLSGTSETSAPSRPVIQCTGASKCVPVCSPVLMLFQYQAGPRSSYLLTSCSVNGTVLANGSGSRMTGVLDSSLAVRSMTWTSADLIAEMSCSSTGMIISTAVGQARTATTILAATSLPQLGRVGEGLVVIRVNPSRTIGA